MRKFVRVLRCASYFLFESHLDPSAYLVQLYSQGRLTLNQVLGDLGRLARRGTLRPEWLQSALEIVAEIRHRESTHE